MGFNDILSDSFDSFSCGGPFLDLLSKEVLIRDQSICILSVEKFSQLLSNTRLDKSKFDLLVQQIASTRKR